MKEALMRTKMTQMMLRLVLAVAVLTSSTKAEGPTLENSLTQPVIVTEGSDSLLTCVVINHGDLAVLWKLGSTILTAGTSRIIPDERFGVIHDEGGDVYVLSIRNSTHTDTGLYTCEVNSVPPARSFHKLTVLSDKLVAPVSTNSSDSASIALWGFSTPTPIDHDYSECCISEGVSKECLGFCNIKNILEGTTGMHPASCDDQFKMIVHCMADGKNHVPCCQRAEVPDICQDMCIGEYTEQTDDVRTHISCSAYTAPTLACIAEGINILPSRPTDVEVTTLSDSSLTLEWTLPQSSQIRPEKFTLNVTKVRKFAPERNSNDVSLLTSGKEDSNFTKVYTIDGDKRSYALTNLDAFSHYDIVMISENRHGQSLPSYKLKILTLSKAEADRRKQEGKGTSTKKNVRIPSLPDVKECCIEAKIGHKSCIDNFCDPLMAKSASVPDLMICAPWSQPMFGCLANGNDHRECCSSRGVPDICDPICSGNATTINYRHFKCMEYMHDIANCMLRGYGVLPSEPLNFRFSNVGQNVGLLHWDPPASLPETVKSYIITYTRVTPYESTDIEVINGITDTNYILESLVPGSSYEVFVEAMNSHGVGDPSTRIVFRTAMPTKQMTKFTGYDINYCCKTVGVKDECLPLCAYNVTMTTIQTIGPSCTSDFHKVTKCAAGGRDHLPCCTRRGVSEECQTICQGLQYDSASSIFTTCSSFIGNIMLCLEEGIDVFPPPVEHFHASYISDSEVELVWKPVIMEDQDTAVDHYEIYFKELANNSDTGSPFDHENNINATSSPFTVTGLKTGNKYRFFVVARNKFGTSLPSSAVTLNVSKDAWDGQAITGMPSSPHSMEVSETGADYLTLSWTAPTISHHQEDYKYRLYYGVGTNSTKDTLITVETSATTLQLKKLMPNTPYILYMTTVNAKGESEPSETVVAWTEPIVPAFAEAPAVHPRTGLVEGGSMTILCIALGTPTPMITLYLGRHAIRTDKTRHLVTTLNNITKDMSQISCYAENGYGTPMQTSRMVEIEHKPYIKSPSPSRLLKSVGQDVTLTCYVSALPAPVMVIDKIGGFTLDDRRKTFTQLPEENPENKYAVGVTILDLKIEDGGSYYCKGNNTHGAEAQTFQLVVTDASHKNGDIMTCCKEQNVTEGCLNICSAPQLDLDLLLFSPQCIPELHKLMSCGSDGSDHRHCCSLAGVPRSCLEWCRGQPVEETESCALSFSPQIAQCFHEGQFTLPGPPKNIKVTPMDSHSAIASWDPPVKNPQFVELYRILWRREGSRLARKIDTAETTIHLEDLLPGVTYELVVKAGNANGTSQLTPPLKFVTADKYVIEAKVYSDTPSIVGALVAVLLLLFIAGGIFWYVKGRKTNFSNVFNNSGDRSFSNPFFNQEVTMSHLQQDTIETSTSYDTSIQPSQTDNEESDAGHRNVLSRLGLHKPQFGFQRFN